MRPWIISVALLAAGGAVGLLAFQRSLAAGAAPVAAPATGEATLAVHVTGVLSAQGSILAGLCDQSNFLKQCRYRQIKKVNATGVVQLKFAYVPPGAYAVMVYHDENDNREFDKGGNGIPLEGYGFSRNARGHYGPPRFQDAVIELKPGGQDATIEMSY